MNNTLQDKLRACKNFLKDAYNVIASRGGTLPAEQDMVHLPAAIESIPDKGYYYNLTQYGVPASDVTLINNFMDDKLQQSLPLGVQKNAPYVMCSITRPGRAFDSNSQLIVLFLQGGTFPQYVGFNQCKNLEYIVIGENAGNTITGGGMYVNFFNCAKLRAILGKPLIIESNIYDQLSTFGNCGSLEEVYIDYRATKTLNINSCPLKYDCLMYLINHLRETTDNPTMNIGSSNLSKLNATVEGQAALAAAQAKGWTII